MAMAKYPAGRLESNEISVAAAMRYGRYRRAGSCHIKQNTYNI